jgi:hypothetical protein
VEVLEPPWVEEKQVVFIEQVDHSNVLNPILRERGIRSLLGVPLLVGGNVLGVLHVGRLSPRRFGSQDRDLLQLLADRIALAVGARTSQAERAAATALQRSLLPAELPGIPGFELVARYVPGENGGVGGDWYDVFSLPSGSLCIVVGDVVGRGLRRPWPWDGCAARCARTRSTPRTRPSCSAG